MPGLPKEIAEFKDRHGLEFDDFWEVRAGGAWAVKHRALERIAVAQGIVFGEPIEIEHNTEAGIVILRGSATLGERTEWTYGEAAPKNNKNGYPWAMAEKRLKDRLTLKLLQAHGALYSEDEAEDFKQNGTMATLPKKDSRPVYEKLQREVDESRSREQLKAWMEANKDRIRILPEDWQDILRLRCEEMLADLRQREAV